MKFWVSAPCIWRRPWRVCGSGAGCGCGRTASATCAGSGSASAATPASPRGCCAPRAGPCPARAPARLGLRALGRRPRLLRRTRPLGPRAPGPRPAAGYPDLDLQYTTNPSTGFVWSNSTTSVCCEQERQMWSRNLRSPATFGRVKVRMKFELLRTLLNSEKTKTRLQIFVVPLFPQDGLMSASNESIFRSSFHHNVTLLLGRLRVRLRHEGRRRLRQHGRRDPAHHRRRLEQPLPRVRLRRLHHGRRCLLRRLQNT